MKLYMNQFIWIFNFKCGIASSDAFCFHIFFPFKYFSVFVWLFHVRPQIRSKPSPCKCILQSGPNQDVSDDQGRCQEQQGQEVDVYGLKLQRHHVGQGSNDKS